MDAMFFETPAAFHAWLAQRHDSEQELWVGFYKKGSGRPSITWPEAVDEALCFGWIDGLRKTIDEASYRIRFTPRKPTSTWSAVNIRRVAELSAQGRMQPAGLAAFAQRADAKSAIYSYEQRHTAELGEEFEQAFRANAQAWAFFQSQPAWYRRMVAWWVISAKKEETKRRRLATLIDDSAHQRLIKAVPRTSKQTE
jgi:uncharacterized protein YdeI (YjbR/CyaY-like superfamily)